MNQAFIKGMDISSYPEMIDMGFRYYDYEGNEVNLIDFAVSQGFNYGRLRIWNEPRNIPEAKGYCDLAHTKELGIRAKRINNTWYWELDKIGQ
ncbi:MAG: glycosyl hydrolase 53 family protein [Blautia sp.]|nr:glycosyl hydrolase 53 family protein [Blautia sp.]MCM1200112.1 glycosyl hydrolase 53 family protein [Bacteroides fragilis]